MNITMTRNTLVCRRASPAPLVMQGIWIMGIEIMVAMLRDFDVCFGST